MRRGHCPGARQATAWAHVDRRDPISRTHDPGRRVHAGGRVVGPALPAGGGAASRGRRAGGLRAGIPPVRPRTGHLGTAARGRPGGDGLPGAAAGLADAARGHRPGAAGGLGGMRGERAVATRGRGRRAGVERGVLPADGAPPVRRAPDDDADQHRLPGACRPVCALRPPRRGFPRPVGVGECGPAGHACPAGRQRARCRTPARGARAA